MGLKEQLAKVEEHRAAKAAEATRRQEEQNTSLEQWFRKTTIAVRKAAGLKAKPDDVQIHKDGWATIRWATVTVEDITFSIHKNGYSNADAPEAAYIYIHTTCKLCGEPIESSDTLPNPLRGDDKREAFFVAVAEILKPHARTWNNAGSHGTGRYYDEHRCQLYRLIDIRSGAARDLNAKTESSAMAEALASMGYRVVKVDITKG